MKTYHPKSWSQQARRMADLQFNCYVETVEEYIKAKESNTFAVFIEQNFIDFFSNSYRHPLVRQRAAKRFGRLVREYKRKKGM